MSASSSNRPPAGAQKAQASSVPVLRHVAELGAVTVTAALAAGMVAHKARAPVLAVTVMAFCAWAGITITAMVKARSAAAVAWWSVSAGCAAGWVPYATLAGWASWPAMTGLLAPAAALGPLYLAVHGLEEREAEKARRSRQVDVQDEHQRKWPGMLAALGYKGIAFVSEEETRAGRTILLRLPRNAKVTFEKLANEGAKRLEIAAGMRRGAARFEETSLAHEVLLHLADKDVLALTIPYPGDLRELTVNEPFPVGLHEDGEECRILFREVAALIVGLRGAGKSNLINVLVAQFARCVDTIIFMIDLKGGRTAAPWLRPWLEGSTPRPVIDWVATTREEAEIMLRAVLRGVDARAKSGAGGEKIIPDAQLPAVILILEEVAAIFGMHSGPRTSLDGVTSSQLASLGTQITQLSRSEAIDPVFVAQRGTVTMIGSGDLKSQCDLRIGLGVATQDDARYVIPDNANIAMNLARLKHRGSGIVSYKDTRPAPVKFFHIEYSQIRGIAEQLGKIRPEPDPELAAALGGEYAQRWTTERAGHLIRAVRPSPVAVGDGTGSGARPVASDDDTRFQEIVSHLDSDGGAPSNPVRRRMLELLAKAGVMGRTPTRLKEELEAEGHTVARQTIQRWLSEEQEAGRVVQGRFGNWKAAGL